jgi:hypothetical protein
MRGISIGQGRDIVTRSLLQHFFWDVTVRLSFAALTMTNSLNAVQVFVGETSEWRIESPVLEK